MITRIVGIILLGGGLALVSTSFVTGHWFYDNFPLLVAGVFIALIGVFFIGGSKGNKIGEE